MDNEPSNHELTRRRSMSILNVGFDNAVIKERVVSIIAVNSTPVKRMIEAARNSGMLIDATHGKRVKAVVITDSNHYILSAIQPETLINRCGGKEKTSEKKKEKKEQDKK